ncbi:MAG: hypothetical protein RBR97_20150 [Bacteroidales bacterium]|nr:hypothetical protein [Bacteroidales bacterium]
MKDYKYQAIKRLIESFQYEHGLGYPEWNESGACSWDGIDGFVSLTERDMSKLINAGSLAYFMIEGTWVPCTILDETTQEWLI